MKPSVPVVPVYYFELTPRSQRLLYFVPRKQVEALVRKRIVRKQALQDFPYGIEVEVSDSEYRLIREEYGFDPLLSPRLLWIAFRGFWLHSHRGEVSSSGVIDARRLEAYARQLSTAVDELDIETRQIGISREGQVEKPNESQGERLAAWSEKRDELLEEIIPKDANPELPLEKQKWRCVDMSPGLSAEEVFLKAQFPERRGRHGSHG